MTLPIRCPIFATRQPLLITGIREVLLGAGIAIDPRMVDPDQLERVLEPAEYYLCILDAKSVPGRDVLTRLCQSSPGSCFVLWTAYATADLLQTALECGIHGLLSSRLPLEDAARALVRICRGERLFRFDADAAPPDLSEPLQFTARERQILMELAEGATNAEIAAALHTTEGIVKLGLSRMFRKTGARSRQQLAWMGRSGPLITEETSPTLVDSALFDAQWMLHEGEPKLGEI